jgi:hypothetical protein
MAVINITASLTQEECEALGDLLHYATKDCDLPEDIALYEGIARKLWKEV